WDLHMKLYSLEADIIHTKEFQTWRNDGLAFPMREGAHTKTNHTLVSILEGSVGYWGDIVGGPFYGFGFECDDDELWKTADGKHVHNSGQVSVQNIKELLAKCDIRWKQIVQLKKSKVKSEVDEKEKEQESSISSSSSSSSSSSNQIPSLNLFPQINIYLLLGEFPDVLHDPIFNGLFDVICLDSTSAKEFNVVNQLCRANAPNQIEIEKEKEKEKQRKEKEKEQLKAILQQRRQGK
ncbi:MAG: putative dynein assembly factor 3, axonemal, partial [Streblomastix strix]